MRSQFLQHQALPKVGGAESKGIRKGRFNLFFCQLFFSFTINNEDKIIATMMMMLKLLKGVMMMEVEKVMVKELMMLMEGGGRVSGRHCNLLEVENARHSGL